MKTAQNPATMLFPEKLLRSRGYIVPHFCRARNIIQPSRLMPAFSQQEYRECTARLRKRMAERCIDALLTQTRRTGTTSLTTTILGIRSAARPCVSGRGRSVADFARDGPRLRNGPLLAATLASSAIPRNTSARTKERHTNRLAI